MKAHFHFIDAHRKEWLGKYKTFNEFYKRFEVTPDMLAQLVATGKEMGVEYNEEEYQKALPLLKLQMKALIARDLWDSIITSSMMPMKVSGKHWSCWNNRILKDCC